MLCQFFALANFYILTSPAGLTVIEKCIDTAAHREYEITAATTIPALNSTPSTHTFMSTPTYATTTATTAILHTFVCEHSVVFRINKNPEMNVKVFKTFSPVSDT